jgi:hypothetical protein
MQLKRHKHLFKPPPRRARAREKMELRHHWQASGNAFLLDCASMSPQALLSTQIRGAGRSCYSCNSPSNGVDGSLTRKGRFDSIFTPSWWMVPKENMMDL